MRCLKAFGERAAARHPDSQTAEIQIRVALMNRSALGTAEIVRVAYAQRGKGKSCLRRELRNNALAQPRGGVVAFLPVDRDVAQTAVVGLDEVFRLHEHTRRPAAGVIDAAFVRFQHIEHRPTTERGV